MYNDAAMAQSMVTVKITGNNQIRRWTTTADQMNFVALQKRCAEFFQTSKFSLTYNDDEGDDVTLGCDEELREAVAIALQSEPPVLRLKLTDQAGACPLATPPRALAPPRASSPPRSHEPPPRAPPPRQEPPTESQPNHMGNFFENLAKQLPELVGRLPPNLQSIVKDYELDIAATAAVNTAAHAANSGFNAASGAASAGYNATTKAAATGLDAAARAAQTAASVASHASDAANAAATMAANAAVDADPRLEGFHPGVSCDKSGMSPIVGIRYNLIGHDYDLNQAEYDKLPADLKPLYQAIPPRVFRRKAAGGGGKGFHPGVTCDKSGMSPIVGIRYHLQGHDYDLCESEYAKLPEEEKKRFKAILPPCVQGQGWRRGPGFGGRCGIWGGPRGRPFYEHFGQGYNSEIPRGEEAPSKLEKPNKPCARFISDVSIHEGTQMMPKTKFTKIWKIRNSGDVPWWPGSKLVFVGGDQLSADSSVPLPSAAPVQPGEEVDVAVDMEAPQEPGRYVGYWRLTGPMGRRKFGQRVWVHMQVVADPNEPTRIPSDEELCKLNDEMKLQREKAEADDEADEGEDNTPPARTGAPSMDTADNAAVPSTSGPKPIPRKTPVETEEPSAQDADPCPSAEATSTPPVEVVKTKALDDLAQMGFEDEQLNASVIDKHMTSDGSLDLDKCVAELTDLADLEWDEMLDDLAEMGFEDRCLNKQLLVQNSGSLKKTVKTLVKQPQHLE